MSHRLSMRVSTGDATYRLLPEIFKHKVVQLAEETVASMQKIWAEAGYDESERQRLLGELLNKLKTTCANEIAAEEQILAQAHQEAETLTTDLLTKHSQLGRTANIGHLTNMTLTDRLAELDRLLTSISKEVSERQSLFDKEMQAISTLVNDLGEKAPTSNAFEGPVGTPFFADLRLQLMRDFRQRLEQVRVQRRTEMESLYRECHLHMVDMCYVEEGSIHPDEQQKYKEIDAAVTKFGRAVASSTPSDSLPLASLHIQHLQLLKDRVEKLVAEKEYRRAELSRTGEEIARLWSLLRVERSEREAFTASFKKNLSLETLRKGYTEAERLKELRKQSLGSVLSVLRSDIENLWVESGMCSAPITPNLDNPAVLAEISGIPLCEQEFPAFFIPIDEATEDLLDQHETYFSGLRQRVEELRPLLLKIHRREAIVQERIELEQLQMNPERLTARGPNAREERKREEAMTNRVKNLEKLTKEILTAIAGHEAANASTGTGMPFLYGGERYSERVTRQEEAYLELRDALRNARKKGKDALSAAAMSSLVLATASSTSSSSSLAALNTSNTSIGLGLNSSSSTKAGRPATSSAVAGAAAGSTSTPAKSVSGSATPAAGRSMRTVLNTSNSNNNNTTTDHEDNNNTSSLSRSRTASKDLSSRIPKMNGPAASQNVAAAVAKDVRNKENDRDSDNTMHTSLTELKDRNSGGSVTVVRETIES